ncbi:MgtC/SapB family protein [Flavihumibacter sp. R14]|nr:MgtC/SapB family protein [Flavihumibacter soli]
MEILSDEVIKVLLSVLCGGILGFEREYQNKSAGFRTIILITLGSTIFTLVSQTIGGSDDRIAANIITGIGFIGAGVIFKGSFDVKGLTTAAVIWIAAAIGMLIGTGHYLFGILVSGFVLLILSLFGKIEDLIDISNYRRKYFITFNSADLSNVEKTEGWISEYSLKIRSKSISKKDNRLKLVLEVSGNKKNVKRLTERLLTAMEIIEF